MGTNLEGHFSEDEVAHMLHRKKSTLQKNRSLGTNHPPFIKVGRTVWYPGDLFKKWLGSQTVHSEIKNDSRNYSFKKR